MKIGHYMPGIWDPGGIASYIRLVSTAQKEAGHEIFYIDYINHSSEKSKDLVYIADGEELYQTALKLNLDLLHLHTHIPFSNPTVPTIRTLHGHSAYCPSGTRYLARKEAPCPHVYNVAGCLSNLFSNRCGTIRPVKIYQNFRNTHTEMRTLPQIKVHAVSHFLKEQMLRAGYSSELIEVIHLPVKLGNCKLVPLHVKQPRFLYLGRIVPSKGWHWMLKAVKEMELDIHLDIAGTGDDSEKLVECIVDYGLKYKVTFHGWQKQDIVKQLIIHSSAIIVPSVWHEPAGFVLLEGMAHGKPVIASRVGGIPEVIEDGINGILVPPGDVDSLIKAMTRIGTDLDYAQKLGIQGYKDVQENYTLEIHMSALMNYYSRCIDEFRK